MTAKELREQYESGLHLCHAHMIEGVTAYLQEGREPGGFLFALLVHGPTSDIPWRHADVMNQHARIGWVRFFDKHMPEKAWGSELRVSAWMKLGGLDGMPGGK